MLLEKNQLTFIVPLDFSRRSKGILVRAIQLADFFEKNENPLIFGLNLNNKYYADLIQNKLKNYRYISFASYCSDEINLSKLRNIALKQVKTTHVVFLDVDIHIETYCFNFFLKSVNKNELNIYPCLYLTKKGSSFFKKIKYSDFINLYFDFRRDLFLHLAFPSFILVCDLKSIVKINYMDESYKNHGYEDFDFILRLMKHKGMFNQDEISLFSDCKYTSIAAMSGYRLQISLPFLSNLTNGYYFFHIYHGKSRVDDYYSNQNKLYFNKKMIEIFSTNEIVSTFEADLYDNFYIQFRQYCLDQKIDFKKYLVFFDPSPGHMWRCYTLSDYVRLYFSKILKRLIDGFKRLCCTKI